MKTPELPFVARLFFLITLLPVAFEMAVALALWRTPRIGHKVAPYLAQYVIWRNAVVDHWILASVIGAVSIVVVVLLARKAMLFWHNVVVAKVSGAELKATVVGFPKLIFELEPELAKAPKGKYFIGLDEKKKPVYLTEWDLDTHGHIMGHTGSGKTRSVLEPLMFQDMRAGKGLLFMDAKGSSENVQILKAMAAQHGRADELKVFAPAYGTRTAFKKTVRFSVGPLLTFLNSGEVSNREVEEFVLHPNALKNRAPQAQGYLLLPDRTVGVSLAPLKRVKNIDFPLRRKAPGEGLDLYSRFVLSREEVSNGSKTKAFDADDV